MFWKRIVQKDLSQYNCIKGVSVLQPMFQTLPLNSSRPSDH